MDDLIAFLREQLASRKAMAVQANRALDEWQHRNDPDNRWRLDEDGIGINIKGEYVCVGPEVAVFLAFNDPDAVLAEVAAKQQIIDEVADLHHNPARHTDAALHLQWNVLRHVVLVLALPFAGHPDYREEWKP